MFDHFAGTYALMCVAFFEVIAVIYVYGCDNFVRDLQYMCDEQIGNFWKITWRFISPVIMFVIFVASIFKSFTKVPEYSAYDASTTHQHLEPYPTWALFIAFGLVVIAMAPVPFIWFVRKFRIWSVEADIPKGSDTDLPSATKSVDTTNKKRKGNGNSSTGNSLSNSINKAKKAFLADGFVPRSNTLSAQHSMDLEKQQQSWTRNRHKSFEK
uniref:Sodium-neurotransmitter symporter n=1 Tax=Meloidogyne floridensis TaxID=298350 RepID=A0A915P6L8_9BILA